MPIMYRLVKSFIAVSSREKVFTSQPRMIIDLKSATEVPELSCDVCIVGTGAAGLALASELLTSGLTVVLVESGGFEHETATQALYDVNVTGLPHRGSTEGRFRVLGGSTTKWGGQALPLMPSDFERREWVAHSGWPIAFDELVPYYARACRFLLVDDKNFDSDLFDYLHTQPPAFDPQQIWYHFSKWSPRPNIRELYLRAISTSDRCTLLLHANVTQVVLQDSLNRVNSIKVHSLEGQKATTKASEYVLCAGGIETARLLLSNNQQQPMGIGNEHDLVGRFFQDHPNAMVGWVKSRHSAQLQRLFNVFHKRDLKYSVRCTAPAAWQRQHQMLNVSMGMMFAAENSAFEDLKTVFQATRAHQFNVALAGTALRVAAHPVSAARSVWDYVAHGKSFEPNATANIYLTCEQEPNPESRILLSDQTDALGIYRVEVRWKLTDLTRQTMLKFAKVLSDEFQRTGIGEIELDTWFRGESSTWEDHIADQFHHMGTARMHDSPTCGVVDNNCRIHSITNLYIGGSAVFPTSGHSNPTLTIIALAIRVADKLKEKCA